MRQSWKTAALSALLAAGLLVVSVLAAEPPDAPADTADPAEVLAEENTELLYSGAFGPYGGNLSWALYGDGALRISGSGEMGYLGSENAPWYPYRQSITSAAVESGVTEVGDWAFSGLSRLERVTLADSVTTIGSQAFSGCTALTSVSLPAGVTEIGIFAFASCTALTSVTIPNGVTEIGDYAFDGCAALTSVTLPAGLMEIGRSAFADCRSLTSISLPAGLMKIGRSAFADCRSLTSVSLPEGLTGIEGSAFYGCTALASITLPEGLTDIEGSAFRGCTALASITLPASLRSVGVYAFEDCGSLTSVTFLGDAPEVDESAFNWVDTTPGRFCVYYTAGASGWTSPEWNGLPSACLDGPEEYSQLDENNRNAQGILFDLNETAHTATVGDNSRSANNAGYTGASGGAVVIPDTVTRDGVSYKVIGIRQYAFSDNQFLKTVSLGANLTSVDPTAFTGCGQFTAFSVGEGNSYYSVQDGVLFDTHQYILYSYPGGKADTDYTVPDTVKTIGRYAFHGAGNLQSVVVPDGVTGIGSAAFAYCTGIREITLPFLGGSRTDSESFWYIWEFYWDEPPAVETVVITGEGLKGSDFYYYRYSGSSCPIRSVTLPSCGTEIPSRSFSGCAKLEELRFTDVGPVMESGVLRVPEQVTSIGSYAFQNCGAIRQVVLPASVAELGELAFGCCTGMESFSVAEDNPNYSSDGWGVLFSKGRSRLIQYPSSRVWPYYNVPAETRAVAQYAFYACGSLVNLYLPETVEELDFLAVDQCPGVTFCVRMGSAADTYAQAHDLPLWYIDNHTLQGIEIYALPEQTVFAMGEEDFSGLYVAALYDGQPLQAEGVTLSYNSARSGVQTVTVLSAGQSAQFDILLYDARREQVVSFEGVSELAEGTRAFAAVYGADGRMLCVREADVLDGQALAVIPLAAAGQMAQARLFLLDGALRPVAEAGGDR